MGAVSFDELTKTEVGLVRAVYGRRFFEPGARHARVIEEGPDPEDWGPDRTVSAAVLCQLVMGEGPVPAAPGIGTLALRAVRLSGVRIVGPIDLRAVLVAFPLELVGCWFDDDSAPLLEACDLAALRFAGCWLPAGLCADQIRTRSDLDLSGSRCSGEVSLVGARISGELKLAGAVLRNHGGTALNADRAQVEGGVFCKEGFEVDGEFSLVGARIGGQLELTGAKLRNPNGTALDAVRAHVAGGVFCREGLEVDGETSLVGARIGGQLELTGAKLRNPGGKALNADRAQIGGGIFGRKGFEVDGVVRLIGARVGGALSLTGAKLRNPGGKALSADRAQIEGGVFCREEFEADGEVRLLGARMAGGLDLTGAKLRNPGKDALNVDRAQIEGSLFADEGFEADGEVSLVGARIRRDLILTGAKFRNPGKEALSARGLEVIGSLMWRPASVLGSVDFGFANVGVLADAMAAMSIPAVLEGFKYDAIHPSPTSIPVDARLEWLACDPLGYSPRPYAQLASLLRDAGHERQARRVLIASQEARWRPGRNWFTRVSRAIVSGFLRWTVGYGYRPWLALIWLLALVVLAAVMITLLPGRPETLFAPLDGAPRPFNALLYVLDEVLPFVDIGYSRWVPDGAAQIITVTLVLLGWTLATAVVAAFAGVLRRGD